MYIKTKTDDQVSGNAGREEHRQAGHKQIDGHRAGAGNVQRLAAGAAGVFRVNIAGNVWFKVAHGTPGDYSAAQ